MASARAGDGGVRKLSGRSPARPGLRALHILSHLRVAMHLAENTPAATKYRTVHDDLDQDASLSPAHAKSENRDPRTHQSLGRRAGVSRYYPLLLYETEPQLRAVYQQSLERSWQVERPERNPLWNVIYAAGDGAPEFDRDASIRTLREIPLDTITWTVRNSQRLDVPIDPLSDRFDRPQSLLVLPYDEIPMWKWNRTHMRSTAETAAGAKTTAPFFAGTGWEGTTDCSSRACRDPWSGIRGPGIRCCSARETRWPDRRANDWCFGSRIPDPGSRQRSNYRYPPPAARTAAHSGRRRAAAPRASPAR